MQALCYLFLIQKGSLIDMKITEINSYQGFLELEKEWDNFLERVNHNVFSRWEWLSSCWKHIDNNKKLLVLLAKENNEIVGIAPLMFSVKDVHGIHIKKIEFIGTPISDYNDFIIGAKSEECMKLFIDYLSSYHEKWNYMKFSDVPETAKTITLLTGAFGNLRKARVRVLNDCPYILLPDSFDTFMESLSSNFRHHIRRCQKRFQEKYTTEFIDYSNSEMFKKGMNILFDLHHKQWMAKGQASSFDNPKIRSFHLDVANLFSEKKILGLYSLQANGSPVASIYGFKYKLKFYAYMTGMNNTYSSFGVGNLLFLHVLKNCIEEGFTEFDFLRGGEDYKYRWNAQSRKNFEIILTRKGIIPQIECWLYKGYETLGKKLV